MKDIKKLSLYTLGIVLTSAVYYVYLRMNLAQHVERETRLSEIGEGLGEIALWAFVIIYGRTLLKLIMGRGGFGERILPDYVYESSLPLYKKVLPFLNRTHIYVGIAAVALVILHIALVGLPLDILFFPVVLVLVIWQGLFGLFLTSRYSPRQLKKVSYLVHAQLITGVMIGVFAYFGHVLVDG